MSEQVSVYDLVSQHTNTKYIRIERKEKKNEKKKISLI